MEADLRYRVQRSGNETHGGSEGALDEYEAEERDQAGLPGVDLSLSLWRTHSLPQERGGWPGAQLQADLQAASAKSSHGTCS